MVCKECDSLFEPVQGDCPYCEIMKERIEIIRLRAELEQARALCRALQIEQDTALENLAKCREELEKQDEELGQQDAKIVVLEHDLAKEREYSSKLISLFDSILIHLKRKALETREIKGHFCDAKAICESITSSITEAQKSLGEK